MSTQYLIHDVQAEHTHLSHAAVPCELQPPRNLDILPTYLDLPSGTLEYRLVDRYLKVLALFSDHLLIPDAWLHCYGPLSEYVRHDFRLAQKAQHQEDSLSQNALLTFLQAGIVVVGLRGTRPQGEMASWAGFDLYDVWSGMSSDPSGAGFGIQHLSNRRMLLDTSHSENREIMKAMSKRITKFLDRNAPALPIAQPWPEAEATRRAWDHNYAKHFRRILLDSESSKMGTDGVRLLLGGSSPARVGEVYEFWERLIEELERSVAQPDIFSRGTIEEAVSRALDLDRLQSYDLLDETCLPDEPEFPNPFGTYSTLVPSRLRLRILLARDVLDRASVIQEALFAADFRAGFGLTRRPAIDALDLGLLSASRIRSGVDRFANYSEVLTESPVPFELLSADEILRLRRENSDFFTELREAQPVADFWKVNRSLAGATRRYLEKIIAKVPLEEGWKSGISNVRRGAVSAVAGGIALLAGPSFAGIQFGLLGMPVGWYADKLLPPLAKYVTGPLDDRGLRVVKKLKERHHMGLAVAALALDSDLPDSISRLRE